MTHFKSTSFVVLILFATLSSMPQSKESNDSEASVELRISTAKSEYLLGEPVMLERLLIMIGDKDRIGLGEGDLRGELIVYIAKGDGEFLQYEEAGFDHAYQEHQVGPGRLRAFHTIFFNKKPVTYHLSDYGRRIAEKGMILTDYAFPEPGEYRIKAIRLYYIRRGGDRYATSARAESNVISIRVKEPEGDDLRMWENMKTDLRIGFFMTYGEAPEGSPWTSGDIHERALQRERVLQEVDRITSEYPNSYLAGLLKVKAQENRARQERYRLEEERRRQQKAASASKIN